MPKDRASRLYRFTFIFILSAAVSAAFLFMVRDRKSGIVLFMGRVVDPSLK